MIPYRDLIFHPEEYKPFATVTGVRNKASEPFVSVDLNKLFMSESNTRLLYNSLMKSRIQLSTGLPDLMTRFRDDHDLNQFDNVESQAVGYKQWVEVLRVINNQFLQYCHKFEVDPVGNPFRTGILVGDHDQRIQKKPSELLAQDIPTIDVWRQQEISISSKKFRDENRFHRARVAQHVRNYDYDNKGSGIHGESLEAAPRYYDQSEAHKLVGKWKKEEWFGL
jgi:hypothetical protein